MRIAFWGRDKSFDFNHIGGMESLVRRLGLSLARLGDQVEFVYYAAQEEKYDSLSEGIKLSYFKNFKDSLDYIVSLKCDHVISIYLTPRDRLTYAHFRKTHKDKVKFHHIYSSWNKSRIKRELLFAEARIFPFNGTLFCISPRIQKYVSRWAPHSTLLLPPVPQSYFCQPNDKPADGKLRVTFAGRVDPGKGTDRAADVLGRIGKNMNVEARLYGFAWSHRPQTIELHGQLLANHDIDYISTEYKSWSPKADENLCNILRETDILLLPYEKLSSTVDTPLLLLEGMANLCAVITPPLGDLHDTYGNSKFLLQGVWDTGKVVKLIGCASELLPAERKRLVLQNNQLGFNAKTVTENFRNHLLG